MEKFKITLLYCAVVIAFALFASCSDKEEDTTPQVIMATEAERQNVRYVQIGPMAPTGFDYSIWYDKEEDMWLCGYGYMCLPPPPEFHFYYIVSPEEDFDSWKGKRVRISGNASLYKTIIYPEGYIGFPYMKKYYTLELDKIEEIPLDPSV